MDNKTDGRKKIDDADKKIARLVAQFNMVTDPDNPPRRSQERHNILFPAATTHMWAKDAPQELLYLTADFFDLDNVTTEQRLYTLPALADALVERFQAVEGIVLDKAAEGETDSYSADRHNTVVERGAQMVGECGGNPELGRRVFAAIAHHFVRMQNEYLETKTGPIAHYLEARKTVPTPAGWL